MTSPPAPRSILNDMVPTPVDGIEGRYFLRVTPDWCVLYVFGGFTKALALDAARQELQRPDLTFLSAQCTYVAPIPAGGIAVQVEVLRNGRRGAQTSVRLWSTEDPRSLPGTDLCVDVVFASPDHHGAVLLGEQFPADASDPSLARSRDEFARPAFAEIPFHRQTDWRLSVGSFSPDAEPTVPRSVSWFRFHESPITAGVWDPAALAVPGDILGPAVITGLGGAQQYFVVTMQLSLQWFAPCTTEWICQHANVIAGVGGFVTGVAELWSETKELVGFATQTAILRPVDRVAADRAQVSPGKLENSSPVD